MSRYLLNFDPKVNGPGGMFPTPQPRSRQAVHVGAEREGSGRLRWPRVLGDTAVAAKRRGMGGGGDRRRPFDVPPALVRTAFTAGENDEEREEALQILSARIAGDPRELRAFLATDAGLIAETLDQYPGAADALTILAGRYQEPAIRTKIAVIQGLLKKRRP